MLDFGEDDAKIVNTVKNVARMRAIEAAREKAGVYIKSFSQMSDGVLTRDEISVVTNNISEVLQVNYEKFWFQAEDAKGNLYGKSGYMYKATVTVKIDTDGINEYLSRDSQEKSKLISQNKNLRQSFVETNNNFEELRKNAPNRTSEQRKAEIEKIDREISAEQKIEEGNKLAYQRDYASAISKYNEAIELNPNNSYVKNNIENVYGNRRSIEQVIEGCNKEIKRNPKSASAFYYRGNAYEHLGDYLRKKENTPSDNYFKLKNSQYDNKNYQLALKDYNKAISLNKDYYEAYNARGKIFTNLGKYKSAIKDFNTAIQIDNNSAEAYNNRGVANCWLATSKFEDTQTLNIIGAVLGSSKALENYKKAEAEKPDYSMAISDFERAIRLNPTYAEACFNLGKVYGTLGDYNKAIKYFNKAIGYNPTQSSYYPHLIYMYKKAGLNNEAQAYEKKYRENF